MEKHFKKHQLIATSFNRLKFTLSRGFTDNDIDRVRVSSVDHIDVIDVRIFGGNHILVSHYELQEINGVTSYVLINFKYAVTTVEDCLKQASTYYAGIIAKRYQHRNSDRYLNLQENIA